jgi:hypothetical protein
MSLIAQATEDGLASGNADIADVFFLIAAILFFIVGVFRLLVPRAIDSAGVAFGLGFLAVGLLLL